MKSYKSAEEMTRNVLAARDAYLQKKQQRLTVFKRMIPVMSGCCMIALLVLGIRKYQNTVPEIANPPTVTQNQHTTAFTETNKSGAMTSTITEAPTERPSDAQPDTHVYLHWDEMTVNQQYFMAEFGDPLQFYDTAEKEVSADKIGDYICQAYMSGCDWYSLTYYHCEAKAYKVKDDAASIAIRFPDDEKYYLYTHVTPENGEMTDG